MELLRIRPRIQCADTVSSPGGSHDPDHDGASSRGEKWTPCAAANSASRSTLPSRGRSAGAIAMMRGRPLGSEQSSTVGAEVLPAYVSECGLAVTRAALALEASHASGAPPCPTRKLERESATTSSSGAK